MCLLICLIKREKNRYYHVLALQTFLSQKEGRAVAGRQRKPRSLPTPAITSVGTFLANPSPTKRGLSVPHRFRKAHFLLCQRNSNILFRRHINCTTDRCYKTRFLNMSFEFFTKKQKTNRKKPKIKTLTTWFKSSVFQEFIDVIGESEERNMTQAILQGSGWTYFTNVRQKLTLFYNPTCEKRFCNFPEPPFSVLTDFS